MPKLSETTAAGRLLLGFALVAALATAACGGKEPDGQTVATVNGETITLSELNLEAKGATTDKARAAALQAVIDRKLFAEDASKQGLEKDPAYILESRRSNELLLAQHNVAVLTRTAQRTPTESDVSAYLDSHPAVGTARRMLTLDQLRFPAPKDEAGYQVFAKTKTIDEIAALLQARGQSGKRGSTSVDTALLPDQLLKGLLGASREPVIVNEGGVAIASQVVGEGESALSNADAMRVARQRLTVERVNGAIEQRNKALREAAEIKYGTGYAPAK